MRKLIYYYAQSIDGYIAGPEEELDWLPTEGDFGYEEFIASIDTVIMGRKTYDISVNLGEYPYKVFNGYVFSRKIKLVTGTPVHFSDDPIGTTIQLKGLSGKSIWLVGGAEIAGLLNENDLIDELIVTTIPVVLGEGIPAFNSNFYISKFQHLKTVELDQGVIQSVYRKF